MADPIKKYHGLKGKFKYGNGVKFTKGTKRLNDIVKYVKKWKKDNK